MEKCCCETCTHGRLCSILKTGPRGETIGFREGIQCHRHAPTSRNGRDGVYHEWPVMEPDDCCGEYEHDAKSEIS